MGRRQRNAARTGIPHRRRLRFEPLEDRRLLAMITVTTAQDVVDFDDGVTSLREAIFAANTAEGPDTIDFDFGHDGPETILLEHGELAITDSLTINGPGAELLTIDASGNDPTPDSTWEDGDPFNPFNADDGDGSRVFNISDGTEAVSEVLLRGLRLTGGDTDGAGGAILAHENLTVESSIITENVSTVANILGGGGIFSAPDFSNFAINSLTVADSVISGNTAMQAEGGGIRKVAGSLVVEESTITGNRAWSSGGGISAANLQVNVQVRNSTISGNIAEIGQSGNGAAGGGGLFLFNAVAEISNSTISGNDARTGGGIGVSQLNPGTTEAVIVSSTVTENTASSAGDGIYAFGSYTDIELAHSIVAGNSADGASPDIVDGGRGVTAFYSLIGDGTGAAITEVASNIVGTAESPIDPRLGPLADNGGYELPDGSTILTHALLPDSPAIDAGDPAAMAGVDGVPEFDQRGEPFARVADGDEPDDIAIDIGAIEAQPNPLPGDYNFNGVVDAADYSVWRDTLGSMTDLRADGSSATTPGAPDGIVDEHDYAFWVANFGNVLAPGAATLTEEEQGAGGGEPATVDLQQGASVPALAEPVAPEPVVSLSAGRLPQEVAPESTARLASSGTPVSMTSSGTRAVELAVPRSDDALLALLVEQQRLPHRNAHSASATADLRSETPPTSDESSQHGEESARSDAIDAALEALSVSL